MAAGHWMVLAVVRHHMAVAHVRTTSTLHTDMDGSRRPRSADAPLIHNYWKKEKGKF